MSELDEDEMLVHRLATQRLDAPGVLRMHAVEQRYARAASPGRFQRLPQRLLARLKSAFAAGGDEFVWPRRTGATESTVDGAEAAPLAAPGTWIARRHDDNNDLAAVSAQDASPRVQPSASPDTPRSEARVARRPESPGVVASHIAPRLHARAQRATIARVAEASALAARYVEPAAGVASPLSMAQTSPLESPYAAAAQGAFAERPADWVGNAPAPQRRELAPHSAAAGPVMRKNVGPTPFRKQIARAAAGQTSSSPLPDMDAARPLVQDNDSAPSDSGRAQEAGRVVMRSSAGASSAAAQTVHPGAARAASAVAAHADPRPGAQAAPLSLAATSFAPPSEPAGDSRPGVAAAPLPLKASVPPAAVPDREFAARHGASTALPAEATAAAAMTAPMSRLPNATREHASPQLVWRKSAVTGGAPAGAATGLAEAIARQRRSGDPVIARETGTDSAGSSSESGVSPSQAAAGVSAESAPDLQALAERVGQLLQRRLEVERERRGLRKWR